jgi:hypothetical protein
MVITPETMRLIPEYALSVVLAARRVSGLLTNASGHGFSQQDLPAIRKYSLALSALSHYNVRLKIRMAGAPPGQAWRYLNPYLAP